MCRVRRYYTFDIIMRLNSSRIHAEYILLYYYYYHCRCLDWKRSIKGRRKSVNKICEMEMCITDYRIYIGD